MKLVVLGGGESGVGAAVLGLKKQYDVFVSDSGAITNKYKEVLLNIEIPFEENGHTESIILAADVVVKSPGIPGLFTTTSAAIIMDSVCPFSSNGISIFKRTSLYLSVITPLSETKTLYCFFNPKIAAPTPLSPPPRTTSFIYLNFKVTIVITANNIPTIQNLVTILLS